MVFSFISLGFDKLGIHWKENALGNQYTEISTEMSPEDPNAADRSPATTAAETALRRSLNLDSAENINAGRIASKKTQARIAAPTTKNEDDDDEDARKSAEILAADRERKEKLRAEQNKRVDTYHRALLHAIKGALRSFALGYGLRAGVLVLLKVLQLLKKPRR